MNILEDNNFEMLNDFSNSKEFQYSNYIKNHKNNVKFAYNYIKANLSRLLDYLEIPVEEMDNVIEKHDLSKYSKEEFEPYAEYYYGNKLDTPEYEEAWKHHYENNPHHPEYWKNSEMPYSCILEMICDWWSFGFSEGNKRELFDYWEKSKDEKQKIMNPKTFKTVEEIIKKIKEYLDENLNESSENRAYSNCKKEAVGAVVASRARHLAANKANDETTSKNEVGEYRYIARKMGNEKDEKLANLIKNAEDTNNRVSIDNRQSSANENSLTADFESKTHMSLHTIRGKNPILDRPLNGRQRSTGYGENNKFIKDMTNKELTELSKDKFEKEKKKIGLKEDLSDLFD